MKEKLIVAVCLILLTFSCNVDRTSNIYFGLNNKMILEDIGDTMRLYGDGFYRFMDFCKKNDSTLVFPKESFEASVLFNSLEKKPDNLDFYKRNSNKVLVIKLDTIFYEFKEYDNIPQWDSLSINYYHEGVLSLHRVFDKGDSKEIDIFSLIILKGFADTYLVETSVNDFYSCKIFSNNKEIKKTDITILPFYVSKLFFKKWKSKSGQVL